MRTMYDMNTVTGMSSERKTLKDKAEAFDQLTKDMEKQQTYDKGLTDAANTFEAQERARMMENARRKAIEARMAEAYEAATPSEPQPTTPRFFEGLAGTEAPKPTTVEDQRMREMLLKEISDKAANERFERQPNAIPREYNTRPLDLPPEFKGSM
jgi:site-specific DNA-cytosine methylase